MHSLFSGDLDAGLGAAADLGADVVADADVNIGKERVGLGGVRGYADVCVELHYGRGQHH